MEDKEKIKNELQNTINELGKLMVLKEQISSNWNDVIAKAFTTKYNKIENDIEKLIKEIEEIKKIL